MGFFQLRCPGIYDGTLQDCPNRVIADGSNCQAIAQESYFVYATSAGAWESRENSGVGLPFGKLTQLLKIAIYSWFTH